MRSVREILDLLRVKGLRAGGPSTEAEIQRLEKTFDLTWPEDYREYLRLAGGGPATSPETITGLWPVASIAEFNRSFRIPWNFPGLVGIGNDGFLVYAFDFRSSPPVIASLGLSSSIWEDVVTDADSFSEWLERRL